MLVASIAAQKAQAVASKSADAIAHLSDQQVVMRLTVHEFASWWSPEFKTTIKHISPELVRRWATGLGMGMGG